jgi:hypothetical protein
MFDRTSTPSTSPGLSRPSSLRAPASPRVPPSTDASTTVLRVARPARTRAISMSAAVSAPLVVASGTESASRDASSTSSRRDSPGRCPMTFSSRTPPPSKRSVVVANP